jgi:serine/threonine-protein kinase RsbW
MATPRQRPSGQGAADNPGPARNEDKVRTLEDGIQVIDSVIAAMDRSGFSGKDLFGVRLAMEEAIVNAVKHGNRGDKNKHVRVGYQVHQERVLVEIEDQGSGFNPDQVPDPTAPENLEKPSGRGLLLMKTYTTWVRFNARGNCVTLCKERSV